MQRVTVVPGQGGRFRSLFPLPLSPLWVTLQGAGLRQNKSCKLSRRVGSFVFCPQLPLSLPPLCHHYCPHLCDVLCWHTPAGMEWLSYFRSAPQDGCHEASWQKGNTPSAHPCLSFLPTVIALSSLGEVTTLHTRQPARGPPRRCCPHMSISVTWLLLF